MVESRLAHELYASARIADIELCAVEMERNGFLIDTEFCAATAERARYEEQESLRELDFHLGTLGVPPLPGSRDIWSSPKQMLALFHTVLRCPRSPVWKKGKVRDGEVKLDEVALRWIALREPRVRPLVNEIINLRKIRGAIKYLTKLPTYIGPDGRVHPVCGPAGDGDDRVGALTGRFAMKAPEGQQIPNPERDRFQVRSAFVAAPEHRLIVADYGALEVVILAHILIVLFGDHQLANLCDPNCPELEGTDIHCLNARRVFGEGLGWTLKDGRAVKDLPLVAFKKDPLAKPLRAMIKTIWYGLMYGKGAYGFGASLTDDQGNPIGEELAGKLVEGILNAIPGIRRYQEWVRAFILEHKGIPSLAGRWCPLADLIDTGREWAISRAWRRALNFPMQAGGADIVGAAMVAVVRDPVLRRLGARLILQVHDELVLECPEQNAAEAADRVKWLMINTFLLRLPLQVSIGIHARWSGGH